MTTMDRNLFAQVEATVLETLDVLKLRDGSVPATSYEIRKLIWESRLHGHWSTEDKYSADKTSELVECVLKETARLDKIEVPHSEVRYTRFDYQVRLKRMMMIQPARAFVYLFISCY